MSDRITGLLIGVAIAVGLILGEPGTTERDQPSWLDAERARLVPAPPTEEDRLRQNVVEDRRAGLPRSDARQGGMVARGGGWHMTHRQLANGMQRVPETRRAMTYHWQRPGGQIFAFSAESTDRDYHFAPGYLTAWQPFSVEQLWKPWYAVANRMRYVRDHKLFPGRLDVWQTAHQSWRHQLGDCEDHALLLADWLINQGEDARVVLGDYQGEGHAWVVVLREARSYLLEATQKFGRRALRGYPLAATIPGYQPRAMFNRETLWINEGSSLTTRYDDARWQVVARFQSSEG